MKNSIERLKEIGNWHWAKTYAKTAPHWYVLREEIGDDRLFDEAVIFIRANGREERFFGRKFIYYYDGCWKFWTMGNPVNETRVINKAQV